MRCMNTGAAKKADISPEPDSARTFSYCSSLKYVSRYRSSEIWASPSISALSALCASELPSRSSESVSMS